MLGVTAFGLIFTPVFYVLCRAMGSRLWKPPPDVVAGKQPAE
jgi:hypothetical protein